MIESNEYTVKKSTCERYDLHFDKGWGWAIFTIDERGGVMTCLSDYGSYNYAWPNHGRKSFKHFLLEIDSGYLLNKVSNRGEFDTEATLKGWKSNIIDARRWGQCTKEEARETWDALCEIFDDGESADMIQHNLDSNPDIHENALDWEDIVYGIVYDYPASAKIFATKVFEMFKDVIRKELAENEATKEGQEAVSLHVSDPTGEHLS